MAKEKVSGSNIFYQQNIQTNKTGKENFMCPATASKRYEQLEHVGDIRIKVFGDTIEGLFINAGFALFDIMVTGEKIKNEFAETVVVSGIDREELIVNWLAELNYLFITESKIFNRFEIEQLTDTELRATVLGEKFNPHFHEIKNEIKAVTFHDLEITEKKKKLETKIVFDI
ncbi:archease [candidate division KSB1 bacterium]|nr:archease [candidate division KSB1 bacterium]